MKIEKLLKSIHAQLENIKKVAKQTITNSSNSTINALKFLQLCKIDRVQIVIVGF